MNTLLLREQQTQLSPTNRAARLEVSQFIINMVTFHMLRMVSYYCAIVTTKTRRTVFLEIRFQQML